MALFINKNIVHSIAVPDISSKIIEDFCKNYKITNCILSSVRKDNQEIDKYLHDNFNYLKFNHLTPLPISNKYETPESLGLDRLATAVGGFSRSEGKNVLCIDAGTCIKFDFVTKNKEYLGGAISPGIAMRYKALNKMTDKLPLIDKYQETPLIGKNTEESIASGVFNGAIAEVEEIINRYKLIYNDLTIYLTGGDQKYFEKSIKSQTFAVPFLTLEGLNQILKYNIEK